MLSTLSKYQLELRGWTPEKLRERIQGCRDNRKTMKGNLFNVNFYLTYKSALKTILSNNIQSPL